MYYLYFLVSSEVLHVISKCYPLTLQAIQYRDQSKIAFLLLVKYERQDEPLDLEQLMKYCLMPGATQPRDI